MSLRNLIQNRLNAYAWPVTDLAGLRADLAFIRELIKEETVFTAPQQSAVIGGAGALRQRAEDSLSQFDQCRGQPVFRRSRTL